MPKAGASGGSASRRQRNWKAVDVAEGLRAAQWSTAGVVAGTVRAWRDAGIEAPEAVRWHEFGFGLEAARW